jgi:uncharacterized cofD-like protein
LQNTNGSPGLKLVAIGGGTGLSTLLSGLKHFVGAASGEASIESLSAIVTVSDDGGSSGRLREELQMLPPGDIRNCMIALSEDSSLLSRLFRYRFRGSGDLAGHSFGNLFLAALTEVTGDFVEAVRLSSEVLASKGHIYPATINDVRLVAELDDGRKVLGETQITASRAKIRQLWLEPEHCLPLPAAIKAIEEADVITFGPGSLFTSIIPNLLVAEVAQAIGAARATKIFISNLMTQPGETDGYDLGLHLQSVTQHAPQIYFDYVIINDRQISPTQAELYSADGAYQVQIEPGIAEISRRRGTEIVRADLLDEGDMVRHNSNRLAQVVVESAVRARMVPAL